MNNKMKIKVIIINLENKNRQIELELTERKASEEISVKDKDSCLEDPNNI
jgi:hypothetical protein